MNSKWTIIALLFSVAVNIAVVGTLVYFWQHNDRQVNVKVLHPENKEHDILWFHKPPAPPLANGIDSLRREYHKELVIIRKDIDAERQEIITQLMGDPVNRDTVEVIIKSLTEKQMDAERLTINHLLEIKPLLPQDEWKFFIQDLKPRHRIQTKIIKMKDGDSTSILVDGVEEIEEIQIFKHEFKTGDKVIELEQKNK
jgi:nitrogen fixation-related uncharacterized protein